MGWGARLRDPRGPCERNARYTVRATGATSQRHDTDLTSDTDLTNDDHTNTRIHDTRHARE